MNGIVWIDKNRRKTGNKLKLVLEFSTGFNVFYKINKF